MAAPWIKNQNKLTLQKVVMVESGEWKEPTEFIVCKQAK